jgi:hypothetical protein
MSDSDYDSDRSDYSDSSDEDRAARRRRHKKQKKKRSRRKEKQVKFEKSATQARPVTNSEDETLGTRSARTPLRRSPSPAPSVSSRGKMPDNEIDGLIDRLSRMSITDSQYAGLYLRAYELNPLVKDIIESIQRQCAMQAQTSTAPAQPQHRNQPPPHHDERQPSYSLDNLLCYGCGDTGHTISECRQFAEYVNQGIIRRLIAGKVYWPNGALVRRNPQKPWIKAINRQRSSASNFAVVHYEDPFDSDDDEYYYTYTYERPCTEPEYQDEYDEYQPEEQEYDEPEPEYWPEADVFAAGRPEKIIRTARKEQFDGVHLPTHAEAEQRKARMQGTNTSPSTTPRSVPTPAPRSSTPAPAPAPSQSSALFQTPFRPVQQQVGPPFETVKPATGPSPRTFDRTKYRSNFDPNDSDQLMEDVPVTKPTPPKKPFVKQSPRVNPADRENKPSKERIARKSEIQSQIDPSNVLNKLLKTPVTLAVGKVLGVSKEMTHQLQDVIKPKSGQPPDPGTNTHSARGDNCSVPSTKAQAHMEQPASEYGQPRYRAEQSLYSYQAEVPSVKFPTTSCEELIKVKVYFGNAIVNAIIDTGSQLNIVKRDFWKEHIPAPRDISKQLILSDANGGERQLDGEVSDVNLNMGALNTTANFYVGVNPPFDLLLGRPWQRGNFVSIDERHDGTYLLFKDEDMKVCYELAATVEKHPRNIKEIRNYMQKAQSWCLVEPDKEPNLSSNNNLETDLLDDADIFINSSDYEQISCPNSLPEPELFQYEQSTIQTFISLDRPMQSSSKNIKSYQGSNDLMTHDDPCNDYYRTQDKICVWFGSVKDPTNGEIIPETSEPTEQANSPPLEEVRNMPLVLHSVHTNSPDNTSLCANLSYNTSVVHSPQLHTNPDGPTPHSNKENDGVTLTSMAEQVLRMNYAVAHLKRLLQILPMTDSSRSIFQLAYQEGFQRLVIWKLQQQSQLRSQISHWISFSLSDQSQSSAEQKTKVRTIHNAYTATQTVDEWRRRISEQTSDMSLTELKDAVKHPPHSEQDKSELIDSDNLTPSEPMEVDNPVDNTTSEVSVQHEQGTTVKHSPPGVEKLLRTLKDETLSQTQGTEESVTQSTEDIIVNRSAHEEMGGSSSKLPTQLTGEEYSNIGQQVKDGLRRSKRLNSQIKDQTETDLENPYITSTSRGEYSKRPRLTHNPIPIE